MKSSWKRVLAVLLAVVTLTALFVPAIAAKQSVPSFTTYVALGDSISAGTGRTTYDKHLEPRPTEGVYTNIVKERLGIADENFFDGAHCGMRAKEMLLILDEDYYGDDYTTEFFDTEIWAYPGASEKLKGMHDLYEEKISGADLISLQFGSNELLGNLSYQVVGALSDLFSGGKYEACVNEAIAKAESMGMGVDALKYLLTFAQALDGLDTVKKVLSLAVKAVKTGVDDFLFAWDRVIGKILEFNSDADILAMGIYNPVTGYLGGGALGEAVSAIIQPLFDAFNYEIQYGSKYATKYVYVNVDAAGPYIGNGHNTDGAHPDTEGHIYLADLVYAALGSFCQHRHTVTLFAKKATLFEKGYSGDEICTDCGKLVKQGSVVSILGNTLQLPQGLGYAVAGNVLRTVTNVIGKLFGK